MWHQDGELTKGWAYVLSTPKRNNIVNVGEVIERTKVRQTRYVHYEVQVLILLLLFSKYIQIKVNLEIPRIQRHFKWCHLTERVTTASYL